ncbi:STAS domain-containing protein [Streptomyces sp. F63]|uniref:STAS domain-containing protein n=1 Tax=Streptomyces sp. F63 TaxID=2824887 RepID=UPI001B3899AB|nr:STAS domain-containing protein [Streptomyces sp. F63]MBQ0985892.1 STAS domain-containing protein [Streptomyces sp. F63]
MPIPEPAAPTDTANRAELGDHAEMTWRPDGPHTAVTVDGSLDVYAAPALRTTLCALAEETTGDLVLDMRDVDFLDSTCLGALVSAVKKLRPQPGRTLRIVPSCRVSKLLRITNLTKIIPVHEGLTDALRAADCTMIDGLLRPAEVILLGQHEFTPTGPYISLHLRLREGATTVNAVRDRNHHIGPVLICHDHDLVQILLAPSATADALGDLPTVVAITENTTDCGPHQRPPTWVVPAHGQGAALRTDAAALRTLLTGPAPATGTTTESSPEWWTH